MKFNFQGLNAMSLFHGKSSVNAAKLMYGESADLFSSILKSQLEVGAYKLLDLGSHKGEFLEDLTEKLKDYSFETVAVDVNENDLKENPANTKITADLTKIPLEDKSVDVTIARYAIAWNNIEDQKQIVKEVGRVTKKLAVIQHQGSDPVNPEALQRASKELFGGKVQELKRDEFYFSSADEVETWFNEEGLNFERVQHREVDDISDLYIEKYKLEGDDAKEVKNILSGTDYLLQTTWVIKF